MTTFCAVLRTAAPGSHAADRLVSSCGRVIPMPIERWWAPPSAGEHAVLDDAMSAALDVGCGPARHVLALEARGVVAAGLDSSDEAVRAARSRGATVHHRSIFDEVWVVGLALAHDLLLAPAALLVAWLIHRAAPRVARGLGLGALAISALVALYAYPLVRRFGAQPDNPTFLPRNAGVGLAAVIAIVWVVAAGLLARRLGARRSA